MVAAMTAMPPPCGVGSRCDERAFGLASAMRCSQGLSVMMTATLTTAATANVAAPASAHVLAAS